MFAFPIADLPSASLLAAGAAILFGAGMLRGFTGYGFAIAAVPLLSLVCPPATAVPIVLALQVLVSAEGIAGAVRTCDGRTVRVLALAAAVATPVGVLALTRLPPDAVRLAIALIVFGATVVTGRGRSPAWLLSGSSTLLFGAAAGVFNGLAGMPGPPVIAYYLASPLGSARARASMIVLFLVTGLVALPPLVVSGALTPGRGALAVAAFPVVWTGSWSGALLYGRSSEALYRRTSVVVLGASAAIVAARALAGLG